MKPIRLDIAGLQSYRETQTVDFERLCQGGVFGIFGPTGSGKSSILDAMTLALYGKVERAFKGTQGIMNGAENKLSVSFAFELSGAGETERYRVERQYKRAGDTAVHGAICRLVQVLPEGDRVLADKQNEVDDAVERLIGLSMPDFTRAVVLPQGKFAEFLTLAGKDRRSMLQRLFRLERYGDALAARLSQRADRTKLSLKETEAEQQGLGDASPETLQAAAARLAEAREAAATFRQRLAEAEERHAELVRRRERDAELKRIEDQLARLAERSEEMAGKERRLERLSKAAELAPAMRDADEAEAEARLARAAKDAAIAALAVQAAAAEQAARDWALAREEAGRREPELLVRLERLEQAMQTERERDEWARQRAALAEELAGLEAQAARLASALAEQEDILTRGKAKQAALKEQLAALLPIAERHGRLQTALSRREQWAALRVQGEEAEQERRVAAERAAAAEVRKANAEAAVAEASSEGRMLQAWWSGVLTELRRFRSDAARSAEEAAAVAEGLKLRERETERRRLAHLLAEQLADGEPCPVCGSASHPHPANTREESGDSASFADESAAIAVAVQRVGQLEQEARSGSERAEWYRNRLAEWLSRSSLESAEANGPARAEAAPAATDAEPSPPATDPEAWERRWAILAERLRELSARCDSWESRWGDFAREASQAGEAAAAAANLADQAEARGRKLASQAEELLAAWKREFPEWFPEDVHLAAEEAAAADKEARELRERLDISVGFLEEQERKRRETERGGHEVSLKAAEARARAESAAVSLAAAESRLREMTGGEPASVLAANTKEELERLRAEAARTQSSAEQTDRERQEAQRRLDAAAERDKAAESARERAARRLAEGLKASVLAGEEELRSLLPELHSAVPLAEEVKSYRESCAQLTAQSKLLRERMAGEPVSEDEWEQSAHLTESLRRETEEALALCAKAERDADDLASRRERWEALESRRVSLAEEASRIAQLQSVFRGNAFVEYIAEEQLEQVSIAASERLGYLTRRRYALEVDAGGGFVIRDDANGGLRRPVSTLSGGETFLTSLALALALSAQIQLRGKYPLQFFFLDEGFGTLDPELLDTVVTSLEKLQHSALAVGVISHVPELQARLPRRLHVIPAEPGGRGSRITFDTM
ncbi:AAA family ATPase [Cohnella sp. CFH 77786]|uniref:AAA family ATPase n=1 Tax=Cohnella sp. CFH 77786 TaxID=2662265 RepID=UPI001C60A26C|nr:AAA family ATPase [Cohnella sp. CFH 77786]MBW5444901.1 AAA family ATPase [Cohnella sp. CFH 77786]